MNSNKKRKFIGFHKLLQTKEIGHRKVDSLDSEFELLVCAHVQPQCVPQQPQFVLGYVPRTQDNAKMSADTTHLQSFLLASGCPSA